MIWKDGLAALAVALLLLVSLGVGVRAQTESPLVPLEGLDPVELINGKEVGGKMAISVTRGRFQYVFANQENKALFEKDPVRYEIQLEGSCARMGRGVTGNPDLYYVHKERIYIFGSEACVLAFKSAPESYLEPAASKFTPSAEAIKKGQVLINKAVEAMGGAAKVDGLVSYQEKAITKNAQGEVAGQLLVARGFPDRYRLDRMTGSNAVSSIAAPNESFILAQKQIFPMAPEQRKNVERNFKRSPLELLRARTSADFKAAVSEPGEAGVEQVTVELAGALMTLGIDPTTGRILTLSYFDRAPNHMFGNITLTYSDFRAVEGLTLPFKVTASINGSLSPALSRDVESITVNGKLDPTLFERPKTTAGQ